MNETDFNKTSRWLPDWAHSVIKAEAWDQNAARVLVPPWHRFAVFVLARGERPASVTDITVETLAAFSKHCDVDGAVQFSEASLVLGAVRLVLLQSGFDPAALVALSAPRRAKRAQKKRVTPREPEAT
jgi:hypothetical protein